MCWFLDHFESEKLTFCLFDRLRNLSSNILITDETMDIALVVSNSAVHDDIDVAFRISTSLTVFDIINDCICIVLLFLEIDIQMSTRFIDQCSIHRPPTMLSLSAGTTANICASFYYCR